MVNLPSTMNVIPTQANCILYGIQCMMYRAHVGTVEPDLSFRRNKAHNGITPFAAYMS